MITDHQHPASPLTPPPTGQLPVRPSACIPFHPARAPPACPPTRLSTSTPYTSPVNLPQHPSPARHLYVKINEQSTDGQLSGIQDGIRVPPSQLIPLNFPQPMALFPMASSTQWPILHHNQNSKMENEPMGRKSQWE